MPAPREYKDDVRDLLDPLRDKLLGKTIQVGKAVWDEYITKKGGAIKAEHVRDNF